MSTQETETNSQEKVGIDELIKTINKKILRTQLEDVYKMVCEQVFLVMLYARNCYLFHDSHQDKMNFQNRIRLIDIIETTFYKDSVKLEDVKKKEMQKQCEDILKLIENPRKGSNDIVNFLKEKIDENNKDNKPCFQKKILEKMEDYGLAFSNIKRDCWEEFAQDKPIANSYLYSYYSMYKVLKYPVYIFQSLLRLNSPTENYIKDIILATLIDYIDSITDMGGININQNKENRKNSYKYEGFHPSKINHSYNMDILEKKQDIISKIWHTSKYKTILVKSVKKVLDYQLTQQINKVFNSINLFNEEDYKKQKILPNGRGVNPVVLEIFQHTVKNIDTKDNEINITLDELNCKNIAQIGNIDYLGIEIIKQLKEKLGTKSSKTSLIVQIEDEQGKELLNSRNQVDAYNFELLSHWYKENKTGLIKKIEQVPKLIAYILECDIKSQIGLFDPYFQNINLNDFVSFDIWSQRVGDRRLLVSAIIRYKLYYEDVYINSLHLDKLVTILEETKERTKETKKEMDKKISDETEKATTEEMTDKEKEEIKEKIKEIEIEKKAINKIEEEKIKKIEELENELLLDDNKRFSNEIMKDWITFKSDIEYQQMLSRFKRMPEYIDKKEKLYELKNWIENQQKSNTPYPISSNIPLPLWANHFYME